MKIGDNIEEIRYKIQRKHDLYTIRSKMLYIIHKVYHSRIINLIWLISPRMPRIIRTKISKI